jgi:hypothetical protein
MILDFNSKNFWPCQYSVCIQNIMLINSSSNFRNLQTEASAVCSGWRAEQGGSGSSDGIPSASLHPSRNCGCCSY